MTAAQRRAAERARYDAYLAECPARHLLERIGDKWVSLTVNALADGPLRYGELRTRLAGISEKMLTQTLRHLERDGLLTRTVTPGVPARVDYELTGIGRSLLPVLRTLKAWADEHVPEILAAREAHDRG